MISPHRKIFGDAASATIEPTKTLRITTQTAYRLMRQQAVIASEQEGQVRIR